MADSDSNARERLSQVFRYLQDLDQLRNPAKRLIQDQPWLLWLRELPDHSSVVLTYPSEVTGESEEATAEAFSLRVTRPVLTEPPTPDDMLRLWLKRGWDDPERSAEVLTELEVEAEDGSRSSILFEEDPGRVSALAEWLPKRDAWATQERPARASYHLFERLYSLRSQLEREAERLDLVVGDGLLLWKRESGDIRHPLLTLRLQLDFDPDAAEFTLRETGQAVELYTALLRSEPDVDGRLLGESRAELEREDYHPLGRERTEQFLKRLAVRISPHGDLLSAGEAPTPGPFPRIAREPVIFLRTRTLGFAPALEAVLEDLRTTTYLPPSLLRIVGVEPPQTVEGSEENASGPPDEAEDVLLCKPFNQEQVQIVRRLGKHRCVLVQGPPGTGKTHTIGNLIGHLLAQGKRILVTSHTPKALRVLRDQVVEPLQPLCVSVLENDVQGHEQLRHSVDGIVARLSSDDPQELEQEAEQLRTRRKELISQLRDARQRLLNARHDEYRDIVIGGRRWKPSDAAREVARGRGIHEWIPRPVHLGAELPLSQEELAELYATNLAVTPEDESEIKSDLPDPAQLPSPDEFALLVREFRRLEAADRQSGAEFWHEPPLSTVHRCAECGAETTRPRSAGEQDVEPDCDRCQHPLPVWPGGLPGAITVEMLQGLRSDLDQAVKTLSDAEPWRIAILADGYRAGAHRHAWERLLDLIQAVSKEASDALEPTLAFHPELPSSSFADQARALSEIVKHLEAGGKLDWLTWVSHGEWKRTVNGSRVAAGRPTRLEEFKALLAVARLQVAREELVSRWDRQIGEVGGPKRDVLGAEPEATCLQFAASIQRSLDWYAAVWGPQVDRLGWYGLAWRKLLEEAAPIPGRLGEVQQIRSIVADRLGPILDARINLLQWERTQASCIQLEQTLRRFTEPAARTDVAVSLYEAVVGLDADAYRSSFQRLEELHLRIITWKRRGDLLDRLAEVAPAWAKAIGNREGLHAGGALPGEVQPAWCWRQFHDELLRRNETRLETLQAEIETVSAELRRVTTQLVDRCAWAKRLRKTDLQQRQALVGWLQLVRRIGRGTGRRAPRLQAEARKQIAMCRSAVSVWVMPLSRVVENFRPEAGLFDVVIIDEASQSDVMALLALYLGKEVVIVGDDQQVSPDAVGQKLDEVQQLIDTHLQGIPNRELYDGQMSIYELAESSFGGRICLLEHFRCVADIIQFSNHLSYGGKIRPLRDESRVVLKPHTLTYRVENATNARDGNEEEAQTVTALIAAAAEQPEYQGKTFGVISLVGEVQANRIDMLLRERLGLQRYERLKGGATKAFCGNAAQFQGDERDVIFLSMVDTPRGGPLPLRAGGARDLFKKRFNVAASRARDQMWLVHSLNPEIDLQADDLRRRLIQHCEDPGALRKQLEDAEREVQSEFERLVLRHLVARSFNVTPQWEVGQYRIDLVVEGNGRRLAIECDGDRFHTERNLEADLHRQAILERLGWTFTRLRGTEFFRDEEGAMARVYASLERMGIDPVGVEPRGACEPSDLRDRVVRRAEELRREWQASDADTGCTPEVVEDKRGCTEPAPDRALAHAALPAKTPRTERVRTSAAGETIKKELAPSPTAATRSSQPEPDASPASPVLEAAATPSQSRAPAQPSLFGEEVPRSPLDAGLLLDAVSRHTPEGAWDCPECKTRRVLRLGRFGPYLACTGKSCKKTESISPELLTLALNDLHLMCPDCGRSMKLARSRYGSFIGCSGYPECKTPLPWNTFKGDGQWLRSLTAS